MSEESDRMLVLLQELALMKEAKGNMTQAEATTLRKRRKEIHAEMKQLAREKKRTAHSGAP